jgi:hypothetical protein
MTTNSSKCMRVNKRRQRARFKKNGWKRLSDVYVHPDDHAAIARYINTKNARRFKEGQRPPILQHLSRPRDSFTWAEAGAILECHPNSVASKLGSGRLRHALVPMAGRRRYITGKSVRAERARLTKINDQLRGSLIAAEAVSYLAQAGVKVTRIALWRLRQKRRGPKVIKVENITRFDPAELDKWARIRALKVSELRENHDQLQPV